MQVYKFLDKNYDQVRQDVLDLFVQSKNKVRGEEHLYIIRNMHENPCSLLETQSNSYEC